MPDTHGILGHTPEQARGLLERFVRFLLGILVLYTLFLIFEARVFTAWRFGQAVVVGIVCVFIQWMIQRGHLKLAIHMVLAVFGLAVAVGLWHRGVLVATTLILPALLPLGVLLLGLRWGLVYAGLNLGLVGAGMIALQCGWQPSLPPTSVPVWSFLEVVVVWVVMVYQRLPAGALEAATERSSQELRELDGVIAQLEAENAQLSALVEERTLGLEAANQSLTRFSASLSHDLRAPLRSIAGFTKVLAESKIPDAARNQIAGLMADTESLQLLLEKTMINLRRETGQ